MSGEKTEIAFCLLAWSHHVPMEMQPREWRRTLTGAYSYTAVVATKPWACLRTGAAAEREELDNKKQNRGYLIDKQQGSRGQAL